MLIRTSQTHAMHQLRWMRIFQCAWVACVQARRSPLRIHSSGGVSCAFWWRGCCEKDDWDRREFFARQLSLWARPNHQLRPKAAEIEFRIDVACPNMTPGENGVRSLCRSQDLRNKRVGGGSGRLLQRVLGERPQYLSFILQQKRTTSSAVGPDSRNEVVRTGSVGR